MSKMLSKEIEKEIIDLYLQCNSITQVAKSLKRDRGAVTRALNRNGFIEHKRNGPKNKLTDDEENELIRLYQEGISSTILAEKFNITPTSVRRICHRHDVSTSIWDIDEETEQNIVKDYISDYYFGTKRIAKKYHISCKKAKEILKKYNIPIKKTQIYDLDKSFFNKIDTEEKAYLLGFLYADGCNTGKRVFMTLQDTDKYMIEKINNLFQPTKPLLFRQKTKNSHHDQYGFSIDNREISKKLEEYGIVKAKTFKIVFPEWLDQSLYRHFIRGYFDGDGSISCIKRKTGRYSGSFNMIGTEVFCNKIKQIFMEDIGINLTLSYDKRNQLKENVRICMISSGGNYNIIKIMNWLYQDATIFLDRKYEKFKIIEQQQKDSDLKWCRDKKLIEAIL